MNNLPKLRGCTRGWNLYWFLCLFHVICKPLLELAVPGREPDIRMNLSAGESATPERGDLVEIFLPPLGLILVGFLGKRDMSIFQIDEFKVYFFSIFFNLYIVYQWFINCLKIRLFNSVILNKTVANGIFFFWNDLFFSSIWSMHC